MRQSRILPLLGPAAVLYLVAEVAAAGTGLSPLTLFIAGVAVGCATAPLWVRGQPETPGIRRVGWLGIAVGVGQLAAVQPSVMSLPIDAAAAVGSALAGVLVLDLALTVPDTPAGFRRVRAIRGASGLVGVAAAAGGIAAVLPPFTVQGHLVIVPAAYGAAPTALAFGASGMALVLRSARRRLGSTPAALASNTWALMGLVPVVAAGGGILLAVGAGWLRPSAAWVRGLATLAGLAAVVGHVALCDPRRRLQAGPAARRALSATLAVAAIVGTVVALNDAVPRQPAVLGAIVVAELALAALVFRASRPLAARLLGPWHGRLLRGTREATEALGASATLEDAAAAVLPPLRRAAGDPEAKPVLYTVEPAREAWIDAAGEPRSRNQSMPDALLEQLMEHPGEVIVGPALEAQLVRRPMLQPLVSILKALDALCVVPLAVRGELEGALVVPRGARRSTLTLEEIVALEALADRISGIISLVSAHERAQRRAAQQSQARDRADERVEALEEELERLRADAQELRTGRGASRWAAPTVAYSPGMRTLERRITEVAPTGAPIWLVAEGGSPVDALARRVHEQSGRGEGPFVVADCASVRPEQTMAALCGAEGEQGHPGWLRLASEGTLVLADVPALSLEAQHALSEALAAREMRPVGATGTRPIDVRVIATSRCDVAPLADAGTFDAELARWLTGMRLDVPPLRNRKEDLDSLVWLAVDRACRVLGRDTVGVEETALEVLRMHDWPGNLRELQHVIDRAVAATTGPQIRRDELPPLSATSPVPAATSAAENPLDGTYTEVERRLLERALERTDGNKSEAARLLGLKRTTFIDKLRRHDLDGSRSATDVA